MIRVLRSTASKLVDFNFEYLRTLEEIKLITPKNREYSYNQLIFSRILLLLREALNIRNCAGFLKNFGTTAQDEIIFSEVDLLLVINSGFFVLPSLNGQIKALTDEWLFPLDKECFVGKELNKEDLIAIREMAKQCNFYINDSDFVIIFPVYRVRQFIENKAIELGLEVNLNKAKKVQDFIKEGNLLVG